ncbi:MAG: 5-methyltetrahydropteroyltriglutamate--homocysteine S-methyltransferase [Alphaproteobacteria bacterium]
MSTAKADPPFRAEHVGSLLRPQRLKEANRDLRLDQIDQAAFDAVLDECVTEAVRLQERTGMKALTAGEYHRTSWFGFFFEALDGFELRDAIFQFHDGHGHDFTWQTCHAVARMRRTHGICTHEYEHVAAKTDRIAKVTMPTPSAVHFFRASDPAEASVYPDMDKFWDDLVAIYRAELMALVELGCRYVQFDEVPLAMLCDPSIRQRIADAGLDPAHLTAQYVAAINRVVADRPDDMTVAMHLCRGNFRSRWMAQGGYEPVAEALFNDVDVDAFFLEYDSERAGDFAPLRHLPESKRAVLGLISTKSPELEPVDEVRRRIDEAAKLVPLERLALSPQCGFASVAGGNAIDAEMQEAKLRLVVEVADKVWGSA